MSVAPQALRQSQSEIQNRLVLWAGCARASGGDSGKVARVVTDFLRHGLCHLGSGGETPAQAVHVHQLLGTLRRQLSGWISEPDQPPWLLPEETRVTPKDEEPDAASHVGVKDLGLHLLRKLELLGECGHRGAGYYLPTPLRLVALPSGAALVVGGFCTFELVTAFGIRPVWAGLGRALPAEMVDEVASSLPRQSLAAWAGIPVEPLESWTRKILDEAKRRAFPTAGYDPASFEIYAPHLHPNLGQRHRWVSPRVWRNGTGNADTSVFLCRTRARPYRFWLSPLVEHQGSVRYRLEFAVQPECARRLLYGIDFISGHSVAARIVRASGGLQGEREVRLSSWPAWEEYQVLAAIGFDCTLPEGPYLPICYRVANSWLADVRSILDGLGIRIREEA
jgi:hypothetical protein